MAKLSANGKNVILKLKVQRGDHSMLFALRSDGKVLRRWTGGLATGYSWFTTLSSKVPHTEATLRTVLANRGYDAAQGWDVTTS